MKSLVLVVFLAILIAGVFVSGGVVQKKVVTTIPLQSTSTEGMTELDEAEGFNHLFGTGIIKNSTTGVMRSSWIEAGGPVPGAKGRHNENPIEYEEGTGWDTGTPLGTVQVGQYEGGALPGSLLHQDASSGPLVYEETYGWDTRDMADNFPRNAEVVSELAPSTIVYVGGTTVPLSTYQTTFGKYLWIESGGLRQYMSIPQYSSLPLMAYTSTGGSGEILEMFPSDSNQGIYLKTYYNFNPGYNRIPYRGDVAGRHYLLFSMGEQSSNAVIIDVNNGMMDDSSVMLGTMPS